jgi:hypothetical protein
VENWISENKVERMQQNTSSAQKVRAIAPHAAASTAPLKAKRGEFITCGQSDDEWPGWIWCTNADGKSGWVPEVFIQMRGERGWMVRDYDATELSVREGEELQVEEEVSDWLLCVGEKGQRGWIPKRNVEVIGHAR